MEVVSRIQLKEKLERGNRDKELIEKEYRQLCGRLKRTKSEEHADFLNDLMDDLEENWFKVQCEVRRTLELLDMGITWIVVNEEEEE